MSQVFTDDSYFPPVGARYVDQEFDFSVAKDVRDPNWFRASVGTMTHTECDREEAFWGAFEYACYRYSRPVRNADQSGFPL